MRIRSTAILAVLSCTGSLVAQCSYLQIPHPPGNRRGVHGRVVAAHSWDQDGAGPESAVTVLGGNFALPAGGNNFARWNKATEQWVSIGSGMDSTVRAFTTANSGSLVAAGSFTTCDGLACSRIAMCDGTTWSALGAGLNGSVYALVTLANGDIIAGGSFSNKKQIYHHLAVIKK